jgi:hypothetical protein
MIEPLPIAFKARERIYRQLARKGIVALYEVRNFRHILIGFELIIIRYQPARDTDQWRYPERERYPSDEEFGRCAWSLPVGSLPLAETAFDQLAARMARNRSDFSTLADFYRLRSNGRGPSPDLIYIRNFLTGRPLPKSPHRTNATRPATETLSEQKCHKLTTNEDSPRRKS